MEIEVTEKHDNLLLERTEVRLIARHSKEATPKRKELKDAIMEALDVKKGVLVIDTMNSEFGRNQTMVFLKVYANVEKARAVENDHVLKRNGLYEEKKKAEGS
jgi:ribosomal protein S24E